MFPIVLIALVAIAVIIWSALCVASDSDDRMDRIMLETRIDLFEFVDEYQEYECPMCGAPMKVVTADHIWAITCPDCFLTATSHLPEELTEAVKAECRKRMEG
jgi:ribosomal protein L37AE/L43A